METIACIKRVPDTGAKIVLTDDKQDVDASSIGYTISPHEECAIEEAVSLVEENGGTSTVLTLGDEDATEQLRTGVAMGADEAKLLEAGDHEWGPITTAREIAEAVSDEDGESKYDLLFFGNESADAQNYQVGIRVANQLGLPVVTGIKDVEVDGDTVIAKREVPGGNDVFEVPMPAVVTVKEGVNTPRYPSMRSRMQARQTDVDRSGAEPEDVTDVRKVELEVPEQDDSPAEVLGDSPEAAVDVVEVLEDLEVV
ncbi:Electron transfer flavoprotein, beta subunit [Halalkaliarchaeum sp. AArc-CO]|uniref:electron transfer flavoprotein subunit beta/FixA family protein n=1 Tax=Halalkaliarchaeum sp. AArc-CO TaxID=2866381 RepID=UPI00217D770F|nr:electron transfer flavoprotein subunit beta/FixA family protein [Halalkaliarchaeum sp. AArc-CO]UWG51551.1 Electron transfer flavoprotein, beta subunit [Halalkaliarchaeum sp. AArc-CO]